MAMANWKDVIVFVWAFVCATTENSSKWMLEMLLPWSSWASNFFGWSRTVGLLFFGCVVLCLVCHDIWRWDIWLPGVLFFSTSAVAIGMVRPSKTGSHTWGWLAIFVHSIMIVLMFKAAPTDHLAFKDDLFWPSNHVSYTHLFYTWQFTNYMHIIDSTVKFLSR